MLKIIDEFWFSPVYPAWGIGIVCVEDEQGDRKAYIGFGSGKDEKMDSKKIIENGSRFHLITAVHLVELLQKKKG